MKIHCVVLNEEQRRQAQKMAGSQKTGLYAREMCVFRRCNGREKAGCARGLFWPSGKSRRNRSAVFVCKQTMARIWSWNAAIETIRGIAAEKRNPEIRSEWQGSLEQLAYVSRYLERAGYIATMKPSHLLVCRQGYFQNGALEKFKEGPAAAMAVCGGNQRLL